MVPVKDGQDALTGLIPASLVNPATVYGRNTIKGPGAVQLARRLYFLGIFPQAMNVTKRRGIKGPRFLDLQ